jgi:hypothetical protein
MAFHLALMATKWHGEVIVEYRITLPTRGAAIVRRLGESQWELTCPVRRTDPQDRTTFATAEDACAALEIEERERLISWGLKKADDTRAGSSKKRRTEDRH